MVQNILEVFFKWRLLVHRYHPTCSFKQDGSKNMKLLSLLCSGAVVNTAWFISYKNMFQINISDKNSVWKTGLSSIEKIMFRFIIKLSLTIVICLFIYYSFVGASSPRSQNTHHSPIGCVEIICTTFWMLLYHIPHGGLSPKSLWRSHLLPSPIIM